MAGDKLTNCGNIIFSTDVEIGRRAANKLNLATGDHLEVDEIYLDSANRDIRLYRHTADVLRTPDRFLADTALSSPIIHPINDAVAGISFNKADGSTNVVTIDTTNSRVGVGTAAPAGDLEIYASAAVNVFETVVSTSSSPSFVGRKSRAALTAVQAGDILMNFGGRGYKATGWATASTGVIRIVAEENFTDTACGTYLRFDTTAIGATSATERVRITAAGNVIIALAGVPVYLTNALAVAGGLAAGTLYRTNLDPDTLCIVH